MNTGSDIRAEVRVGPMVNIERTLRSLGCDPEPVFAATEFTLQDFRDIDRRVDFYAADRLLAECVRASGCPHFGLQLGQWALPQHLGLVAELFDSAPDVRTALQELVTYLDLHDTGGVATIEIQGNRCLLGYALHQPDLKSVPTIYDLAAVNLSGIVRGLCGINCNLTEVLLARSAPEDATPYRRLLRAPLRFDAPQTAVVFPRDWLHKAPPRTDSARHLKILHDAREQFLQAQPGLSGQVREILRREIASTECTAGRIADILGLHERTLHRRLRNEDTSFREQLEDVRKAVSLHYLAATALPVSDIALALGYGSNTALDHAFKRWYGTSPRQWRKEVCAPAGT